MIFNASRGIHQKLPHIWTYTAVCLCSILSACIVYLLLRTMSLLAYLFYVTWLLEMLHVRSIKKKLLFSNICMFGSENEGLDNCND